MSGTSHLVIDLETVIDPDLPPPKSRRRAATSLPAAPYHQIVVLCAALLDPSTGCGAFWIVGEGRGKRSSPCSPHWSPLLNEKLVKRAPCCRSSRSTGAPSTSPADRVARCLRHGLGFPWYYQRKEPRNRYAADGHLDLMDFLADHGATKFYSLDVAAKLIGLPGKGDTHGSDVAGLVARGELDQVRTYCMQDVAQTSLLFLRTQLLRGKLAPHRYVAAVAQGMLEAFDREPRLAPMVPLIDRGRLLLSARSDRRPARRQGRTRVEEGRPPPA